MGDKDGALRLTAACGSMGFDYREASVLIGHLIPSFCAKLYKQRFRCKMELAKGNKRKSRF